MHQQGSKGQSLVHHREEENLCAADSVIVKAPPELLRRGPPAMGHQPTKEACAGTIVVGVFGLINRIAAQQRGIHASLLSSSSRIYAHYDMICDVY